MCVSVYVFWHDVPECVYVYVGVGGGVRCVWARAGVRMRVSESVSWSVFLYMIFVFILFLLLLLLLFWGVGWSSNLSLSLWCDWSIEEWAGEGKWGWLLEEVRLSEESSETHWHRAEVQTPSQSSLARDARGARDTSCTCSTSHPLGPADFDTGSQAPTEGTKQWWAGHRPKNRFRPSHTRNLLQLLYGWPTRARWPWPWHTDTENRDGTIRPQDYTITRIFIC